MSEAVGVVEAVRQPEPHPPGPLGWAQRALDAMDRVLVFLAMLALLAASLVLTYSAVARYFFRWSTYWQDEFSVFLLIGVTFLCAASVQAGRGHVGIRVLEGVLSPRWNQWRLVFIDFVSGLFCGFFAWKSWTLFAEAVHEKWTTSTVWAAPLWVPFGVMALGMTLLALRLLVQLLIRIYFPPPGLGGSTAVRTVGVVAGGGLTALLWQQAVKLKASAASLGTATMGVLYGSVTLGTMLIGVPIAFALGLAALVFMRSFMSPMALDMVTQNVYEELANITLLSIPLFILKGAAIGKSPAGEDLYRSLHAWMHRIPGGLGIVNVFACALFAAMAGSSPATCSAIGSAGIPEMRRRGYSPGFAAGIIAAGGTLGILLPPSITMILYSVAAGKDASLGRLFLAAIIPGLLLVALFAFYVGWRYAKDHRQATAAFAQGGEKSALLEEHRYTFREKVSMLPRVLPFLILLTGVMVALYGGYATPSETAGIGAVLALILVAAIYRLWRPSQIKPILTATIKESTMLMLIIGMSLLFSYVMSDLRISQAAAEWIVGLKLGKWALLTVILLLVLGLGFFLPPVSIILMTAPIILPPLKAAGFDLVWFGVIMTIVMEMGLIHPPVGLNIFVINNIAPDIPVGAIVRGVLPFIVLMTVGILLICFFPGLALWLPSAVGLK